MVRVPKFENDPPRLRSRVLPAITVSDAPAEVDVRLRVRRDLVVADGDPMVPATTDRIPLDSPPFGMTASLGLQHDTGAGRSDHRVAGDAQIGDRNVRVDPATAGGASPP